jgi:hypothetical protein
MSAFACGRDQSPGLAQCHNSLPRLAYQIAKTSGALRQFQSQGGITIAQHPNTADYSEMPRSAINTGSIDYVLPPEAIAGKLEAIGMDLMAGTLEAVP